ncbi:recombinase RecT [Burkholderia stagnalis]|uniref:recombinase RecT n=1 Tax=Burkholderia stagnalis TaxID=1503054 RepID=UPI001E35BA49|nr:recombinase RecT [Burkholderia stagnalis]
MKQVATGKKDNPVASFSSFLDKFKPQMALALPKHLTADRMARLAVTAFSSTPKLQECEPKTIVAGIMTAATLGLEIGVDGQGFLVPYGRTCQFVPGWKGLVDLVSRSGRATVWTGAVFEGDEFDYALGDSPFIRHRPGEENDPDKITHVYAVGRVNGSEYPVIEVWTIRKVWKHRDKYNKVGAKHYSFRDPEMYARKVPLLQVLKYMPKSIELQNAMAIANAADNGHHAVIDGNFVTVTDPDTGATVDPSTGEITDQRQQQSDMTLPSYDDLLAQIQKASDEEVLALVLDSARDLPQDQYVKLEQAHQDRREVLLGA